MRLKRKREKVVKKAEKKRRFRHQWIWPRNEDGSKVCSKCSYLVYEVPSLQHVEDLLKGGHKASGTVLAAQTRLCREGING